MSAATVVRYRNRVRWQDLTWVSWRQHRGTILATGIVVLAGAALMGLLAAAVDSRGSTRIGGALFDDLADPATLLTTAIMAYAALIAVFWTAPLIAREYEHRTHLLAWSQDVTPARWLAGKTTILLALAVALALVLGVAGQVMAQQLEDADSTFSLFRMPYFEAAPLVQLGYTLFGFALGLALSAATRRTILSMGLTLAGFVVTRLVVAIAARPYYQPPLRTTTPLGARYAPANQYGDALFVDSGLLDAAGNTVDYPSVCTSRPSSAPQGSFDSCLREHGIVARYRDYQPIDRLGTFHLIEFGLYTALALLLFTVVWRLTRRTTRL